MSENIKFTKDATEYEFPWMESYGGYSENDTGVMVDITQDHTSRVFAVVRLTTGKYVLAPLSDIEYVSA